MRSLALQAKSATALTVNVTTDKSVYEVGETITYTVSAALNPFAGGLFGTGESLTGLTLSLNGGQGLGLQQASSQLTASFTEVVQTAGSFLATVGASTTYSVGQYQSAVFDTITLYTTTCIFGACFQVPAGQQTVMVTPAGWTQTYYSSMAGDTAGFTVNPASIAPPTISSVPLPAGGMLLLSGLALAGFSARRKG